MATPANALKFSLWLAATHPKAFRAVLNQVDRPRARFGRFGDVYSDIEAGTYDASALRNAPSSEDLQFFTPSLSSDSLQEFTPTVGYESDPTLTNIAANTDTSGFDLPSAAASVDNSGGFWSSLGSGLSSLGSGLSTAIGKVAGAALNPQTLAAAGTLAASVIKANGANAQQQAVLQAQVARTQSGAGAHPLTYSVNPSTGQTIPMVYNPATGQYQMAPATSLGAGVAGSLTPYVPYILVGGGILIAALLMRR